LPRRRRCEPRLEIAFGGGGERRRREKEEGEKRSEGEREREKGEKREKREEREMEDKGPKLTCLCISSNLVFCQLLLSLQSLHSLHTHFSYSLNSRTAVACSSGLPAPSSQ
jgi:hypothetical protein